MSFNKIGSPQPIRVINADKDGNLCEVCKVKPATTVLDGKLICEDCLKSNKQ